MLGVRTAAASPRCRLGPRASRRSIPTTAGDRVYCKMLAHGAVHAAFAGYTGITVGLVNTHVSRWARRRLRCRMPQQRGGSRECRAVRSVLRSSGLLPGATWQQAECRAASTGAAAAQHSELPVCCHRLSSVPALAVLPAPQYCYLPIPLIIQAPRKVDPTGELWNRLRSSIGEHALVSQTLHQHSSCSFPRALTCRPLLLQASPCSSDGPGPTDATLPH